MNKLIFNQICQLVMAEDVEGINQLLAQGHSIHMRLEVDTPSYISSKARSSYWREFFN